MRRWLRVTLFFVGLVAVLSGLAIFHLEMVPETALGWILLPLGGAALLLVEALAEVGAARARHVLTLPGLAMLVAIVVLLAYALAVAWTHLA